MDRIMVLDEDIAAVEIAIEICNRPEIKKEILSAPGSDYDIHKGTSEYSSKKQWSEIVEKKSREVLENLRVEKQLQEKVLGIVLLAGMRMLTWAEYHEGTLGISRDYSFNFLNKSFFTQQGILDNKKAAEDLMKDKNLNTKQKYKLACLYCFEDHIPDVYKEMAIEDKKEFYDPGSCQNINQPELVKFWSYYLMSEIDKLKGEKNLDQYRLEIAVESGSIAAVDYCLEKTNSSSKKDALVVAAVEAVKCKVREIIYSEEDWVVFRYQRYRDSEESWVPSDFYVDILSFLLSKMDEDQQVEFLKKDVEGDEYETEFFVDLNRSRVLEYFLNWPYQDYFMKTVRLMWEFLPERDYAVLLLRICDKIKPRKEGSLKYGEERSYDYRELLNEFWHQSPERYKRYVFSNQEVDCVIDKMIIRTKVGVRFIIKLLTLKNFSCKDGKNIALILASATDKEKENMHFLPENFLGIPWKNISSWMWRKFCKCHMEEEKWEILDRFSNLFLTKEEEDKFKKDLCFTKEAKYICIEFIRNDQWNAAESFIKWSSLPEDEIYKLKKEIIYSKDGMSACKDIISPDKKLKAVDQFIRWCLPSEEEAKTFRKELIFSFYGAMICARLLEIDQQELVSEFINFCMPLEGELKEFKKYVAYKYGSLHCEYLISDKDYEDVYDNRGDVIGLSVKFQGGKWEQVEKFLTWCFSSEEEINDFKKNELLKEYGTDIHYNLIYSSQWDEAETFFTWLGLSTEEIKKLKKDTFNDFNCNEFFRATLNSEKGNTRFVDYGAREDTIELLLRWYGTDKETVIEYQKGFKHGLQDDISREDEDVLKDLDFMIEQRLNDLDEEQREIERKMYTSSIKK